jgi:peptide/nickel transport system permease protein
MMLYNAQKASALSVGAWWDILTPCFALALLGVGLSLLNFAVDEIANPRLRTGNRLNRWTALIRSGEGRL